MKVIPRMKAGLVALVLCVLSGVACRTAATTPAPVRGNPMRSETHGGEDVAIYARGPHAFLFQGTMEQNAIY